jgi:hypothetical protein
MTIVALVSYIWKKKLKTQGRNSKPKYAFHEEHILGVSISLWIKELSKIFSCPCIFCSFRNNKYKSWEGRYGVTDV